MLRLVGGTHFLVLRTGGEGVKPEVRSFHKFDRALAKWDAGSRISPIFALENAPPPLVDVDQGYLVFLGPLFPGHLSRIAFTHAYLTVGLFNIVLFCGSHDEATAAAKYAEGHDAGWECWDVRKNVLESVKRRPPGDPADVPERLLASMRDYAGAFLPTARECQTLLATTYAKASALRRPTTPVLTRFTHVLRQLLRSDKATPVEKLQYLVTTNVALSRQLWQTYAGCAPILDNPCHISTNSLLAIGTASLALERLARFCEETFERAQLPQRLRHLQAVVPHPKPLLFSIPSTDAFWNRNVLFESEPPFRSSGPAGNPDDPPLPQLTYFSSRDGFRSTDISLSAPVEVVTACNTPSWTLQTLTHELTHTLIHSILGSLLPDPADESDLRYVLDLLGPGARPRSLFDQLRAFITFAIWRMNAPLESQIDKGTLPNDLRSNLREADEILTHVFDYLYHYHEDPLKYVRSIWVSWATVPNIGDRVSRYVVRSLCAIHASNLRREDSLSVTIDALSNLLTEVSEKFPHAQYIPDAVAELKNRREYYRSALASRILLVRFVRHVLFAEEVAREIASGSAEVEGLAALHFGDEPLVNPLAFVEHWSQDVEADPIRSIWMLQYLAHGRA